MIDLRGWARGGMRLTTIALLGFVNIGCPGGTSTTAGGSAGSAGDGGTGGTGGTPTGGGGTGGATCQVMTEICDGKDNDCNGEIDDVPSAPMGCDCDDGDMQECYTGATGTDGVGTCKKGQQTCANGAWGECVGEVVPVMEACNLEDDDCNGTADDMGQASCGVGACAASVEKCVNGVEQTCVPGQPSVEVCDGVDNNCNQFVDEVDPQINMNCLTNLPGACAQGKFQCNAGVLECVGSLPSGELCDGIDNDCNGILDDTPGTGGMCSTGALGVCTQGVISCQLVGGQYVVDCYSVVPPSMETCDGLDNDCDGQVDDGDPGGGTACATGLLGVCSPGILHCVNGAVQCVQDVMPSTDICNNLDDNCDGMVDENNPGSGQSCTTGIPGACNVGTTNCQNGAIVCTQTVFAQNETCNSVDDNCNGSVDEGNPGGGAACSTGNLGVCAAGTITCTAGQLACAQDVQPQPEVCGNAVDENCDGVASPATTVFFNEAFANNSQGWTLDTNWQIGAAVSTNNCSFGNDPATDHTPTADNGLAGVLIGGCYPAVIHPKYCLTSPNINTTVAPASVFLTYWRHLHSDYPNYLTNSVEVSANGGSTWTAVWTQPVGQQINDANWTFHNYNITAYKSTTTRVRFCYQTGPNSGIINGGGWSVDDVQIVDAICN